jgi:dUTPase
MTIKFLKIRDVKPPTRAYEFDAGIDFFVPEFTPKFIKDLKEKNPLVGKSVAKITWDLNDYNDTFFKFDEETGKNYFLLAPEARVMIPSGIKSRMAKPGRALIAANKSGIATKHGLIFGAQVIDYTYKGEIHLSLINTSTKVVRIYEDMKILQFLEMPVFTSQIEVTNTVDPIVDAEETEKTFYKDLQDDRGAGGFGSTDKKEIKEKK